MCSVCSCSVVSSPSSSSPLEVRTSSINNLTNANWFQNLFVTRSFLSSSIKKVRYCVLLLTSRENPILCTCTTTYICMYVRVRACVCVRVCAVTISRCQVLVCCLARVFVAISPPVPCVYLDTLPISCQLQRNSFVHFHCQERER